MQYIPYFVLIAPLSALFVYYDAVKNKLGKQPHFTMTPFTWGFCTLLCWPVFLGLYLFRRGSLVQKAMEHPQAFETAKGAKFAFFTLFVVTPLALIITFKVAGPSMIDSAAAAIRERLPEQFAGQLDEKYPPEEDETETADGDALTVEEFDDQAMPEETQPEPLAYAFRTDNVDLSMGLPRNVPVCNLGRIAREVRTIDRLRTVIEFDLKHNAGPENGCEQLDLFATSNDRYIGFAKMADGSIQRIDITKSGPEFHWTVKAFKP